MKGIIVGILLLGVIGCTGKKVALDKDKFTALLIDMHRMDGTLAVARNVSDLTEDGSYAYYNTIFKKYGIDQAQFDSCMYYYSAQTALFSKMYDVVIDSLNKQLTATNIVMNELREQDSVNWFPVKDTLFFDNAHPFYITEIDSIVSGQYRFSATIQFDTLDAGKNNRITAFFLSEKERRDTVYVRDTLVRKDTTYKKGTSLIRDTLLVKEKLREKGVFIIYDTLKVRDVQVVTDTIERNYNWSQYVDSSYTRLVIKMVDSDNLKKLKGRHGRVWNINLFKPYISRDTEKRLKQSLKDREKITWK